MQEGGAHAERLREKTHGPRWSWRGVAFWVIVPTLPPWFEAHPELTSREVSTGLQKELKDS